MAGSRTPPPLEAGAGYATGKAQDGTGIHSRQSNVGFRASQIFLQQKPIRHSDAMRSMGSNTAAVTSEPEHLASRRSGRRPPRLREVGLISPISIRASAPPIPVGLYSEGRATVRRIATATRCQKASLTCELMQELGVKQVRCWRCVVTAGLTAIKAINYSFDRYEENVAFTNVDGGASCLSMSTKASLDDTSATELAAADCKSRFAISLAQSRASSAC